MGSYFPFPYSWPTADLASWYSSEDFLGQCGEQPPIPLIEIHRVFGMDAIGGIACWVHFCVDLHISSWSRLVMRELLLVRMGIATGSLKALMLYVRLDRFRIGWKLDLNGTSSLHVWISPTINDSFYQMKRGEKSLNGLIIYLHHLGAWWKFLMRKLCPTWPRLSLCLICCFKP